MKRILFVLLLVGFAFGQSNLGRTDGQVKMQNEVVNILDNGGDAALNVATGDAEGIYGVNVFGRAISGLQTTATDLWDRANASATQKVWVAPTTARLHAIVSDDASDVAAMGIWTLTGNITDSSTCTIGDKVYLFESTLTNTDGNVHIGASASATIDNFIAAINLTVSDSTDWAIATTANDVDMIATVESGDLMNLYVNTADTSFVTTDDDDAASWGATSIAGGAGARTIRVHGLTSWDAAETTEDIYLRGVYSQNTANSYVAINKIEVLTKGATNVNAGTITATAATDASVTAVILPDAGQTQMGIYSFPSTQTAYITNYFVGTEDSTDVAMSLLVNPEPEDELTKFVTRHVQELQDTGTSFIQFDFNPYFKVEGPAIIKLQGTAAANDADVFGGFGLILKDN